MAQVLSWNPPAAPQAELIAPCVRALKAGQLVGVACETCYFVAADPDSKSAMAKLQQIIGANPKLPILTVHAATEQPEKILANGSGLARRLARRVWPGPVVISTVTEKKGSMVPRYAPNSGSVRLLIQMMGKPLAFGAPRAKDEPLPTEKKEAFGEKLFAAKAVGDPAWPATAARLNELVGEHLSLILDAGPAPFANIPTLIEVTGNQFRIPIVGVVPAQALAEQTAWLGVFVCTGNTCRSPLAEEMCKKMMAAKLECEIDQLESRGFRITSMGLSALPGNTATSEALIVAREFKVDLSGHRSRPMEPGMLDLADTVIAMTAIHRDSIVALHPNLEGATRLLCGSQDLNDPIGSDLEVYRTCAKTIQKHLDRLVGDLLASGAPTQMP
jgi:L-threonylcarbamoyladenylate synthase